MNDQVPVRKRGLRKEQVVFLCRLARERGGLSIAPSKVAFLEQRISRRMRESGHSSFDLYLASLSRDGGQEEVLALIEALTTHTTSFFRERSQFEWLEQTGLPQLIDSGAGREHTLTLWSAACSTGAEMWSAAMVLDRMARRDQRGLRWQVVGSDLSRPILNLARRAIYSEDEIAGLPEDLRRANLLRSRSRQGSGHVYRISGDLRNRALFHQANLVERPPMLDPPADVAMLRNVLIYFDTAGRDAAVRNVLSQVRAGGFLLTGHSESLNPLPAGLVQIASSIYRKG